MSVYLFLFVCPRAYLRNYTSDLRQLFAHLIYGRGSVLIWWRCDMLCTSGFTGDVIFAHKGPRGGMPIPLQRVTLSRCRAQANAPVASYWLRRDLDYGGS